MEREMMTKGRAEELLREAAKCFEDDCSPFEHSWLSKHKVTADECSSLSFQISAIINGYLAAPPETRKLLLVAYAMNAVKEAKDEL